MLNNYVEREPYVDEQVNLVASDLVGQLSDSEKLYHCYLIGLQQEFHYEIPVHDIVLAVRNELELDDGFSFDLQADRGNIRVCLKYAGEIRLTSQQGLLCQRFQSTLLRVLLDRKVDKLSEAVDSFHTQNGFAVFDYLLLPATSSPQKRVDIDWKCVCSVLFPEKELWDGLINCSPKCNARHVYTKNGVVCGCMLENSLVYTPHNGNVYCITGTLYDLDGNSLLKLRDGGNVTYKEYYKTRHDIDLKFEKEALLKGRDTFLVQNYLHKDRHQKEKEPSNASVELPPELCVVIMSPISISTIYSFSFVPSIMHRIESLLIAGSLKRIHAEDHCKQNVNIPTIKVLEAITTKKCQETFHLKSLETLGDLFLKYAVCQQLFKLHQNNHEGLLSIKKDRIVCNATLCKLGCDRKLPGFIRDEPFDPKKWIIPGDHSGNYELNEEFISTTRKFYTSGKRKIKGKVVANVVEALIGAFLSTGGEAAALSFMNWIGIKVEFTVIPYERHFPVQPEKLVNVKYLESLLNYTFKDASLLVEALTHGSYMLPEIPGCYQRLEFLGDAVLDYVITMHMYHKYPGMSSGLLTDLRSASVNNDCYAHSAVKSGLHMHILHASYELHKHIVATVHNFEQSSSTTTFGWESEATFPKVLGDIIESLAGAILVDSGYNKEIVMGSIKPLLEPMITPETVRIHPVRELYELCQKLHYPIKKTVVSSDKGVAAITVEVEANGVIYKDSCSAGNKEMAKKLAYKSVLESLRDISPRT